MQVLEQGLVGLFEVPNRTFDFSGDVGTGDRDVKSALLEQVEDD